MLFRISLRPVVVAVLVSMIAFLPAAACFSAPDEPAEKNMVSEPPLDPRGLGGRLIVVVSQRMSRLTDQLSEAGQGLLAVPGLIKDLAIKAREPGNLLRWGEMAGKLVLVLAAGFLAGWLVRRMLSRMQRAVDERKADRLAMRVVLIPARTILDILPIVAFGIVAYGILPLTDPRHETRLVALTLINANVLARLILAASDMLLVPKMPSLRLVPVGDETVFYLHVWIRRAVGLGVYGYFMLEAGLLMGIPDGLYVFLMKFLGFAVTLIVMTLVMQNKNDVAQWLRREKIIPAEEGKIEKKRSRFPSISTFKRRFADVWHIVAIIFIAVVFFTWALEIEDGPAYLLSGLIWTAVVVVLAGSLLGLIHRGVDRLYKVCDELKTTFPGLEDRVNRYQPFVRRSLKAVVYVIAVFSIFEAWGLGTFAWLFSPVGGYIFGELVVLVLIVAGAFVLWETVSIIIDRSLAREAEEENGSTRKMTLLPLLRTVVRITLAVIAGMLVLSQIGINIGPLLAGAGVIGLAVGFGAQTLVRDVITGAFILLEDAICVGDWVEAGGHSGTVERLTIRTLALRDLTGTVHLVPFGEVTTVANYNRDYGYALIDAGVAYRERYGDVVQALQDVATGLRQDETWGRFITGDLEVFGLNKLADSAVEIRVRLRTMPMRQFAVRRAFLENMKRVFDERGIEIPFPHRTVWFGTEKDGTAPPAYFAKVGKELVSPPAHKPAAEQNIQIASESEASKRVVQEKEDEAQQREPGDKA